ncbi:MAG: hypothetical protein CSA20_02300 [Deltaproteobacteria bacterium]|nr:MAG: hypothetical protein CSB23_02145 [Deltaproteobacteria bacterium]PIE73610.1 MAG: hypothetical protein CSA20_02300 [Deltaproteobacteria bacterium]
MSDKEEIIFLSYSEAVEIVGAIQEEEDIEENDRRIFTVYNKNDKEICWFDYNEVMADVGEVEAGKRKETVQNYILQRIPTWVRDM